MDPAEKEQFQNHISDLNKEIKILKAELTESKATNTDLINRTMKVHQENEMIKSSEEVSALQAMFTYEMTLAKTFATLKNMKPEEAFIIMKAGQEMGLSPMISMNMLYIVNGSVNPYGDKMLGLILSKGYSVRYENEVDGVEVTVVIYNEEGEEYEETAKATDKVLSKSNAMKFAPKNKLRFHGIRMIASFHLSHLFMGTSDNFSSDFHDFREGQVTSNKQGDTTIDITHEEAVDHVAMMKECKNQKELSKYYKENKDAFRGNLVLTSEYGKLVKFYESKIEEE